MSKVRKGSHATSWLTVHLIFVTKYRYNVLTGSLQKRCRDLLCQKYIDSHRKNPNDNGDNFFLE